MIAEIHGKISRTGANLHDRLEDQLTGDFFGTIRYLPFEIGLLHVLQKAQRVSGTGLKDLIWNLGSVNRYNYEIDFWPKGPQGEMDILLKTPSCMCGIEVKYESGLSSEDPPSEFSDEASGSERDVRQSRNQLARYAEQLAASADPRPKHLMFLAPVNTAHIIAGSVVERKLIPDTIGFWLLTWQDALQALKHTLPETSEIWQKLVLDDLIELLERKGFDCFRGFGSNQALVVLQTSYLFYPNQFAISWNSLPLIIEGLHYEYN